MNKAQQPLKKNSSHKLFFNHTINNSWSVLTNYKCSSDLYASVQETCTFQTINI